VGLFNIMQEGDVQIKGYPIRLPLDLAIVFSANPEDYTARGKIITPLKDRIGSEIRTHYPATVEEGIAITAQEAWTYRDHGRDGGHGEDRNGSRLCIPKYVQEVIERIAFAAREDKKVDKRSGVSQRLPISAMENVVSNAERRALTHRENSVVPRISDIYAALPAITGKLELEYEGEMKGADHVSRELIRTAIAKAYDTHLHSVNMNQIVQWFDLGGEIQLSDNAGAAEVLGGLRQIQGLMEKMTKLNVGPKDSPEMQVSAAEFILEGLHAHKKIGRNEERVFTAGEKAPKPAEKPMFEREEPGFGRKRSFN
jgi:magnesium chelatase subunit I